MVPHTGNAPVWAMGRQIYSLSQLFTDLMRHKWLQGEDSNLRSKRYERFEIGHFSTLRFKSCGSRSRTDKTDLMRVCGGCLIPH